MQYYIGQTRAHATIAELAAAGIGECVNRGDYTPRRHPWFLDNGAYADHLNGRSFDAAAFELMFERTADAPAPEFVVLPDIVAGGSASLEFSLSWYRRVRELWLGNWDSEPRVYVAVQDGMTADDIDTATGFDGVFVGGTTEWKLAAAPGIIQRAHGLLPQVTDSGQCETYTPVHVGRVGTGKRVAWARLIGADSCDSSLPLRGTANREIAVYAATEDLEDVVARFAPGGKMAAETVYGLARRSWLAGNLDEDTVELMNSVDAVVYSAVYLRKQQRRASR